MFLKKYIQKKQEKKISHALTGKHVSEETKRRLSMALSGENNPFYGKTWTTEHRNKIKKNRKYTNLSEETKRKISKSNYGEKSKCAIKVSQYSLNGVFLKEWCSASEAARQLNLNQSNISEVCRENRKECGGYIWRYYKKENITPTKKKSVKKVIQKLNGEIIKIYDSISVAGRELNLDPSSITKCCKGKSFTCGGFTFEYY